MANDPTQNPAAYGSVPGPTTPYDTASQAVSGSASLGTQVYSQLPGYQASLGNIGENIQAETSGQVPEDVIELLKQQGAEGGVSTGAASNAAYLKALGLTSLGLENTGLQQFESVLPNLPGAAMANNPNFYVTPGLAYEAGVNNQELAAAPNPMAAAQAGLAATRSGFQTGAGPGVALGMRNPNTGQANRIIGPGGPVGSATALTEPAESDALGPTSPWDTTNAPGTPGAYNAWNAWNNQPVYPTNTTDTGSTTSWNPDDEAIPQSDDTNG
ncbi:MAG TPA: hypothetical protein VMJ12_01005 [Candidatus Acidoferrales bacterium]|nr:hypothetical protein [Candidatus Acidoferrales bacterium]